MSLFDLFHREKASPTREITGTISESPSLRQEGDSSVIVFHLDTQPGLEFRQALTPLAPERRRGDLVRVHGHVNGDRVVTVDWVEKLS